MKNLAECDAAIDRLLFEGKMADEKKHKDKVIRDLDKWKKAKTYIEFGATEEGVKRQIDDCNHKLQVIEDSMPDKLTPESKSKYQRLKNVAGIRSQLKLLNFIYN